MVASVDLNLVKDVVVSGVVAGISEVLLAQAGVGEGQGAGSLLLELISEASVHLALVGGLVCGSAPVVALYDHLIPIIFELKLLVLGHFDPVNQLIG